MNQIYLSGYVGKFIKDKALPSGTAVLEFDVSYKESNNTTPMWFKICCYGKSADMHRGTLKQGDRVLISGKVLLKSYTAKDGIMKNITEIVPFEVHKLEGFSPKTETPSLDNFSDQSMTEEDIPF